MEALEDFFVAGARRGFAFGSGARMRVLRFLAAGGKSSSSEKVTGELVARGVGRPEFSTVGSTFGFGREKKLSRLS